MRSRRDVRKWYDEFAFHRIYHRVNHFCIVDLSAFYFDIVKDRLYTYAPNSLARRSAQTAIWRIGEALVRLLAPILSFTCEEVWQLSAETFGAPRERARGALPRCRDILGDDSVPATIRSRRRSGRLCSGFANKC